MDTLIFRPISKDDAESLHAVHAGARSVDSVGPISTLEGIPSVERIKKSLAEVLAEGKQNRWWWPKWMGRLLI